MPRHIAGYKTQLDCLSRIQALISQIEMLVTRGMLSSEPLTARDLFGDELRPVIDHRLRQANGTEMVYRHRMSFYDRSLLIKRGDTRLEYSCTRKFLTLETAKYWESVQLCDSGKLHSVGTSIPHADMVELLDMLDLDKFSVMIKE